MHPEKALYWIKKKDSSDVGALVVENLLNESSITFPNDHSVLSNPNMFIRDAGGTCHSIFDDGGSEKNHMSKSTCGTSAGKRECK